jgi:hypothetical protein
MSHIATVDLEVHDLDALREAAERVGLELVYGQQRYRWYGSNISNYPLPAGFTTADLGQCDHAIRIPPDAAADMRHPPYEIGIARRRDGKEGWLLFWDFWMGGYGLQDRAGPNCEHLSREYAGITAIREAMLHGFSLEGELRREDGSVRLELVRY